MRFLFLAGEEEAGLNAWQVLGELHERLVGLAVGEGTERLKGRHDLVDRHDEDQRIVFQMGGHRGGVDIFEGRQHMVSADHPYALGLIVRYGAVESAILVEGDIGIIIRNVGLIEVAVDELLKIVGIGVADDLDKDVAGGVQDGGLDVDPCSNQFLSSGSLTGEGPFDGAHLFFHAAVFEHLLHAVGDFADGLAIDSNTHDGQDGDQDLSFHTDVFKRT